MPGQQATVAGLGVEIGILQNILHQFKPCLESFQSALAKMKAGTLENSPLIGLLMNQTAIISVELGNIPQAARFFKDEKELTVIVTPAEETRGCNSGKIA
ncbi:protein KINESIN LIGHT CHAIN-RELATED 3-like [Physcomitrium patens]|uniref:protein KINESIN LIGHT CHAIN-RELATED 3-like n=1 Tax=Physcomitrium patens TaxID=3218 RepID=UPI003CCDA30D